MSIRVLLSCKHKVIAEGIAAVLRTHADIQLVGITDEDLGTKTLCELEHPQVVVAGVDPRRSDDVALTRWVSRLSPRPEIVAFSTDCDRGAVLQMMLHASVLDKKQEGACSSHQRRFESISPCIPSHYRHYRPNRRTDP